jgi:hypothetical protein
MLLLHREQRSDCWPNDEKEKEGGMSIDFTSFTPGLSLAGGLVIGAAAAVSC